MATPRLPASAWKTFKFEAGIKQPIVLRPMSARWPVRMVLAALKWLGRLPTTIFRSHLSIDCNERIVEYPFVLQRVGDVARKKILTFGCTESVLSISLAALGAQVVGVDLREYGFRHPNFSFVKGDFLRQRLPESSFDIVVAVSAVEHCGLRAYGSPGYDKGDFLAVREFGRILKVGGRLIITVPVGKRYEDHELRVYDPDTLSELVASFEVKDSQYYRKDADGECWLSCSRDEASVAGYDPITGVEAVALLVCVKPLPVSTRNARTESVG